MNKLARLLFFAAWLPALGGCYSYIRVAEDPYFDAEAFAQRPPNTLALAPFENNTTYEEAGEKLRDAIYSGISTLPYDDVELSRVDGFINAKAQERNVKPEELNDYFVADPQLADAVLFGEIEDISRVFLLLYARVRLDMHVAIIDSATKKKIYQNRFVITNRSFSLPLSLPGIATSVFSTISFMRGSEFDDSLEEFAEKIAEYLPRPQAQASLGATQIETVEVSFPRQTMRPGEQVSVRVLGTPGRVATFSIGKIAEKQPLVETGPGEYLGTYIIRPKDDGRFLFATITMRNPKRGGEIVTFEANDHPFAIDTTPPPTYRVASWSRAPGQAGVTLQFAPDNPTNAASGELPAAFHVYRSAGKGGPLVVIGTSEAPEFADSSAEEGAEYDYGVVAEDAAGNKSPVKTRVAVKVVPVAAAPED